MKRIIYIACMLFWSITVFANPLIIGTTRGNPPMASQADTRAHFIGFEVDMMNEICTRLHLECVYQAALVSEMLPLLLSGKIDFAVATIIVSNGNISPLLFSVPYLPSMAQFMTLKDASINSLEDLKGKTIGMRLGTFDGGHLFEHFVLNLFKNQVQTKRYLSMPDLLQALSDHQVDAVFSNQMALKYWYYNNMNLYKLIAQPIPIGNGYGLLTTTKNEFLVQKMNQTILTIMKDGTYKVLYDRYF